MKHTQSVCVCVSVSFELAKFTWTLTLESLKSKSRKNTNLNFVKHSPNSPIWAHFTEQSNVFWRFYLIFQVKSRLPCNIRQQVRITLLNCTSHRLCLPLFCTPFCWLHIFGFLRASPQFGNLVSDHHFHSFPAFIIWFARAVLWFGTHGLCASPGCTCRSQQSSFSSGQPQNRHNDDENMLYCYECINNHWFLYITVLQLLPVITVRFI